jgi:hypothetical protein
MVVSDVQRLFERLVQVIADQAPELLDEPIQASDLYERFVPYRANRTLLGFDSNQDYEMAFLRLLSGEQGLADIEHDEARIVLADEASAVNPHPGAFRRYASAYVRLNPAEIDAVLVRRDAFAPPAMPAAATPAPPASSAPATEQARPEEPEPPGGRSLPFEFESSHPAAVRTDLCPHCEKPLPSGRVVKFCPFCGGNATSRACPKCGTSLEAGWRHCVTCGYRVDPPAGRRTGGP